MPAEISSPLANYFDGISPRKKPGRLRTTLVATAVALAVVPTTNSVLAADISLGVQDAEFGQGSLEARECDDVVTIALNTSWYATGAYFQVDRIDLGDVNLTSCNGKTLTVSAFDSAGIQLDLNSGVGSSLAYDVTSATVVSPITGTSSSATIPLTVATLVNSTSIDKMTVQTSDTAG